MNKAKNKRKFVPISLIIFLITAGLLDLRYKGLFYRLLPSAIQSYSDAIFGKINIDPHHDKVLK